MTEEMLEILIGKYLDGEITPIEQRLLDQALQKDSQAKELFEQLQDLHRASQEAIDAEITDRERDLRASLAADKTTFTSTNKHKRSLAVHSWTGSRAYNWANFALCFVQAINKHKL